VTTVYRNHEVSINGVFFDIHGEVRGFPRSSYPDKIVIGDTDQDSQKDRSIVSWTDLRGGIGKYRSKGREDVHRAWYSTAQLGHDGHLVLPPLATTTAAIGGSGDDSVVTIIQYRNGLYVDASGDVYVYDNIADSWGSSLHSLPTPSTDAIVVRMGGVVYLVFATSSGYTYFDGTTWTDDTEDMLYLAKWNDKLWGIDFTGRLRSSSSIGTWANDAILPLEDGQVTDMFVSRDASGNPIIYVASTQGLFAHDNENTVFLDTELGLPRHPDNGKGSIRWRGGIHMPSGLGIYDYRPDAQPASVRVIGPDLDDGLPADRKGKIVQLESSNNKLLAFIANNVATTLTTSSITSLGIFASASNSRGRGTVRPRDLGHSLILGWSQIGWEVLWESADDTEAITSAVVADAYGKHRMWWAQNQRVLYMDLPVDIINPTQVTTFEYGTAFKHHTPWFTGNQSDVNKLALLLRVESTHPSTSETLTVGYRTNYSDGTFSDWSTITTSGETELPFPVTGDAVGVEFRAIQFEVDGARGASNTNSSPDLIALTLEWIKKIPVRWSFTVDVFIRDTPHGKAKAVDQRAAITTALESNTLVKFQYGVDEVRTYLVRITAAPGIELTGKEQRGSISVTMIQP
jgi:hypothetical protein